MTSLSVSPLGIVLLTEILPFTNKSGNVTIACDFGKFSKIPRERSKRLSVYILRGEPEGEDSYLYESDDNDAARRVMAWGFH